jgi:hypothetical protein
LILKKLQVKISVEITRNFVQKKTNFVDDVLFCFNILLVPYLAASLFHLCFDLVNTLYVVIGVWLRLDQFVSRKQVSLLFIPTIEEYAAIVEWKLREENQILGKRHNAAFIPTRSCRLS